MREFDAAYRGAEFVSLELTVYCMPGEWYVQEMIQGIVERVGEWLKVLVIQPPWIGRREKPEDWRRWVQMMVLPSFETRFSTLHYRAPRDLVEVGVRAVQGHSTCMSAYGASLFLKNEEPVVQLTGEMSIGNVNRGGRMELDLSRGVQRFELKFWLAAVLGRTGTGPTQSAALAAALTDLDGGYLMAFADWLEERGDPLAELVRQAIEIRCAENWT